MFQKINYAPIFNYKEFLDNSTNSDCEIQLNDGKAPIKAHKLILANSSTFFYNMFTGQMTEAETGTVEIEYNPGNLVREVINWMYDGKIDYDDKENVKKLLQIYAISAFYGVSVLQEEIEKIFKQKINPQNMLENCEICYENELNETLNFLAVLIGKNLKDYDVKQLSDILDVRVYAIALKNAEGDNEFKLQHMKDFIGDYEMKDEDKVNLKYALKDDPQKEGLIQKIFPALL